MVNYSRVSEDVYLEVKMLMEELAIEEWAQTACKAYQNSVSTIKTMISILELKFDEDEEVQE